MAPRLRPIDDPHGSLNATYASPVGCGGPGQRWHGELPAARRRDHDVLLPFTCIRRRRREPRRRAASCDHNSSPVPLSNADLVVPRTTAEHQPPARHQRPAEVLRAGLRDALASSAPHTRPAAPARRSCPCSIDRVELPPRRLGARILLVVEQLGIPAVAIPRPLRPRRRLHVRPIRSKR